jgi:hypothetical protein
MRNSKLQQQASTLFETASSVHARRSRISFAVGRGRGHTNDSLRLSSSSIGDPSIPHFLSGRERLDGNWGALFPDGKATFVDPKNRHVRHPMGFASFQGGRTPPVFLQELAHLASLMTAVALSTLRNDVDGAESPLDFYQIGSPWPEVDPREIPELHVKGFSRFIANLQYFLGVARTPEERTKYNAARPLSVLGGVSDNEITFLQMARGPYAKTQLCWMWLSEFITREHLAGTLGDVGAPIISRIIQFLGDGMVHYNHARKIMFIPFPFPHAQLSAVYVLVMIPMIPYMMDQYCLSSWIGCTLTFLSVACLSGIHEVARELENPFRNVPNELPVCTLMAEFNEALVTMYAGYHPDFFWEAPDENDYNRDFLEAINFDDDNNDNNDNDNDNDNDSGMVYSRGDPKRRSLRKETFVEGSCEDSSCDEEEQRTREDDELAAAFQKEKNHSRVETTETNNDNNNTDSSKALPENGNNASNNKTMSPTDDGDTSSSMVVTSTPPSTLAHTKIGANYNYNNNKETSSLEVDQLRAIVQQQGKMMETMLEEQARLNKMIEAVFQQKDEDAASVNTDNNTATA